MVNDNENNEDQIKPKKSVRDSSPVRWVAYKANEIE